MYLSVDMHRTQIGLMGVCRILASSFDMANATRNEAYLSEGLLCKAPHDLRGQLEIVEQNCSYGNLALSCLECLMVYQKSWNLPGKFPADV